MFYNSLEVLFYSCYPSNLRSSLSFYSYFLLNIFISAVRSLVSLFLYLHLRLKMVGIGLIRIIGSLVCILIFPFSHSHSLPPSLPWSLSPFITPSLHHSLHPFLLPSFIKTSYSASYLPPLLPPHPSLLCT